MYLKRIFFTIYWCLIAVFSNAQNLWAGFPTEINLSPNNWDTNTIKAAFQFYWKAKDGNFYPVNDKVSSKKKFNNYQLFYSFKDQLDKPTNYVPLPIYFNTKKLLQIKHVKDREWIMQFVGLNNKVYQSTLKEYNSAKWMEQIVMPNGSNKTLKEIVIPGSHDAGMSVLTATGGQQKGTINACNTLTQEISIEMQLQQGIRMFDLRAGMYNQFLYTKHAAADCMEDAIGGGYGERLKEIAIAVKKFLQENRNEIILISFSHFCEKELPLKHLQESLINWIGEEHIYKNEAIAVGDVPLKLLAGKVILSFEIPNWEHPFFPRCDMTDSSNAFINFRRAYASTNNLKKLIQTEEGFFRKCSAGVQRNDLIRLDWQITQSSDEASAVCNDFQDEHLNPLVNGAILLANMIRKNKSIIDHAKIANQQLPVKLNEWILNQTITTRNKPNIIYVDVAGAWATDYCVSLLQSPLYQ